MRRKIALLALLTVGFGIPLSSTGDDSDRGQEIYTLNALKALGHDIAPGACGKVKHNLYGDTLEIVFHGHKMVPEAKFTLKCGDEVLGEGDSNADGLLEITAEVSDPDALESIAGNPKRKFDLWQGQHRVSRSADIFDFELIND